MAKSPMSRYADLVGDGTGTKNAALLDGSSTAKVLKIVPAAGEIFDVERIIISTLVDANSLNVGYGKSATALTNGIEMKVITGAVGGSTVWDITDGIAITKNQDWKNLCFDENVSVYGNLKSQASYRYTFSKDGKEIILDGDLGDELQITISDDLTAAGLGLDEHYFRIGFSKIS